MNNPFKEIISDEKLPEYIRQKVIDDINLIKLSIDMADLFMVKSPGVLGTLFDDKNKNPDK
ncbi:hypothetical protein [Echinicola vietnamensis]|uniref:Uncharacterized protein n=1 Tax=Echinicola vietnamensis (strain DSM 17526 / LMG 23754 / KMM 6221) TaxID=926556 RepID=L0G5C6_ECHVK|nr:hypothetical protein [Echinicola vietnamensis]AGA80752.1 hypothetical protein Echvi_4579 [Echinicola vietnamensis DSM 17526]